MRIGQLKEDVKITLDSEQVDIKPKAVWVVEGSADNAVLTITKAGETGKSHYILGVHANFQNSARKTVVLKDDTTIIWENTTQQSVQDYPLYGIKITQGNDVSVMLDASGTGGIYGALALIGHTE